MSPSLISTIITIAFFVIIALGFLFGFLKGAMKSLVDVIAALACTILALPITKIIVGFILLPGNIIRFSNWLISVLPSEAGEYVVMAQELLTNEGTKETANDIVKLVASLPILIVSPIVYMLVFAVLAIYLYIIALIIKIVACQKTKALPYRFLGGGFGAIACGIIFVMFLTPVWGYSNLATNVIDQYEEVLNEEAIENDQPPVELDDTIEIVRDYTNAIKKNGVPLVGYTLGGRAIFNSTTTMKVSGIKINLEKEISGAFNLYKAVDDLSGKPVKEFGDAEVESIENINKALEKSEFLPLLLSKVVSLTANEYHQGHAVLGVEKPNLSERFNPTFDRVLAVLKDTSTSDVKKDVRTVSNIVEGAITTGLWANATGEVDTWAIFENSDFLTIAFVELYKNPRTKNTVPYLVDAITNYTHDIYNDINDAETAPDEFNYDNYTEEQLALEAVNISNMTKELHAFYGSAEFSGEGKVRDVVSSADMAALGRGLEYMRDGLFTGRMFKIVFHALLHSEMADEIGIIDDALIENANQPDADLDKIFVSRQNIFKLAIAIQEKKDDDERKELMHSVVEDILQNDESASSMITKDNLLSLGMTTSEAESVEAIVNSMVDGAHKCEFESEEEKAIEIEKTEVIIDAVSNTVLSETSDSMFKTNDNDTSTTDMTAKEFVDGVLDSKLSSSMVNSAVVDENGEKIEDPYQIHDSLTASDKEEMTNAITESYAKEDLTDEERQALDSLSEIFGVTVK